MYYSRHILSKLNLAFRSDFKQPGSPCIQMKRNRKGGIVETTNRRRTIPILSA